MFPGTLKVFKAEAGYGFISRDDGQRDTFVHVADAQASGIAVLAIGQRLSFDVEADRRDPNRVRAVNLKVIA